MSIGKYEDLNDMQIDVLREVGNIGSGNATTALSSMVGKLIDIEVPKVEVLDFNDAIEAVGGPEKVIAGILIRINGDIDGMIMFLFEQNLIALILETFFGDSTAGYLLAYGGADVRSYRNGQYHGGLLCKRYFPACGNDDRR